MLLKGECHSIMFQKNIWVACVIIRLFARKFQITITMEGSLRTLFYSAITKARELNPKLPLFVSGKSFGGRMSSQYLAGHPDSSVNGIIFCGFPLHPSGKPSTERGDHLKTRAWVLMKILQREAQWGHWLVIFFNMEMFSRTEFIKFCRAKNRSPFYYII
jgi:hypothetical protein